MEKLVLILGVLVIIFEIYRLMRKYWIQHRLGEQKKAKPPRKAGVMRPKSERDCPKCVQDKGKQTPIPRTIPKAWSERKGAGGRQKQISTEGYFCSNASCNYYGVREEQVHALVWDGSHGKYEEIRDLKCQACGKKFTIRKNTVLYRLKTHSGVVEKIMWLLALGVDATALEEVFGVRENTIRTWLCRGGMQGRKLHERFMVELELIHVQLDELWGKVKSDRQEVWLWAVTDVTTKLVPVLQLGGRTQAMAYSVAHELRGRLRVGSVPVFSTDGLKHYYYALTAHFGKWELLEGGKPVWVLLSDFIYGQVIKHQHRRKTVQVERRMLWGDEKTYRERLKAAGLSGRIKDQPA